ncbi:MAG: NAD(P)/FAD-dependent oxidoreductase [Bdellovibrionales bacterium]
MTRVVIVGGGFAGLNAAKVLALSSSCEITIVDRRNYHLFQPLLYQVATAALSPADIATPIRSLFEQPNVTVLMENVSKVDLSNRRIWLGEKGLDADYLILACGAKHSYFHHPEWEDLAPGLKTLEQATEIRRRILLAYELAEKADEKNRARLLTFVVVGGGPTGVELAGAIAEIARSTLEYDFRRARPENTRILLIEAGSRLLPAFSEKLSQRALLDLTRMGVEVKLGARVSGISTEGVKMGDQEVPAQTVLWAAGVQPSSLNRELGVELDRLGRVRVNSDLSIPGHPNVFVLGDQAHFPTPDQNGLPGLAPVAMQQGTFVGKLIEAEIEGRPRWHFEYNDKGIMATIGRRSAVVQVGRIQFGGTLAWMTWLFIHIFYLIGFKNRIFVFLQWAWSYLTFKKGARLIVEKEWRSQVRHVSR